MVVPYDGFKAWKQLTSDGTWITLFSPPQPGLSLTSKQMSPLGKKGTAGNAAPLGLWGLSTLGRGW